MLFRSQVFEQGLDAVHRLDYSFFIKPCLTRSDREDLRALWPDYIGPGRKKKEQLMIRRAELFKDSRRRRRMGKPQYKLSEE